MDQPTKTFTAFAENKKIASGDIRDVAAKVKRFVQNDRSKSVLIFDDQTGKQIDIDLRGPLEAVLNRLDPGESEVEHKKQGPGRPKLGVIAREVTLLPNHWDWLAAQPGGASVMLRKLVEEAKKKNFAKDQIRQSQEAAHAFMTVIAGDLPNFEEALRALYARDDGLFGFHIKSWPKDIRDHALKLAKDAFASKH